MKTIVTKKLEELLSDHFIKLNEFYVFECTIGWFGKERVDCIMYNCKRDIYCYEIKQTKQDFHSKANNTFIGNLNYYVMPFDLYNEVENEIPYQIGCYVSVKTPNLNDNEHQNGYDLLYCIRRASRQELKADKEVILSSMLRSMQRDRILDFKTDCASDNYISQILNEGSDKE